MLVKIELMTDQSIIDAYSEPFREALTSHIMIDV